MLEKVARPLPRLPERTPGTARRSQSLQIWPQPSWDGPLRLFGVAADSRVDDAGQRSSDEPAKLVLDVDAQSRITALTAPLPVAVIHGLLGENAVSGFRARLAAIPELASLPPIAGLLDDVPIVRLISGYARMMKAPNWPAPRGDRVWTGQLNICRGWAEGATPHRLVLAGEPVVNTTTPAPTLAEMLPDPSDFPAEPAPRPDSMCRRRLLEVTSTEDGGVDVYTYQRDSYLDDDGAESSLHEYVVRVRLGPAHLIERVEVEPRALPFPECPLAAPQAHALEGSALRDIHRSVRTLLSGTAGCTHLSDTLRYLRFVEPLTADRDWSLEQA